MNNRTIYTFVAISVLVLVGAGAYFLTTSSGSPTDSTNLQSNANSLGGNASNTDNENGAITNSSSETNSNLGASSALPLNVTVHMSSAGFSPRTVTVARGGTVTFMNDDSRQHWPASDPHPFHTGLSGFDSLRGLGQGAQYAYTFERSGQFGYHDHLNASLQGSVIVE